MGWIERKRIVRRAAFVVGSSFIAGSAMAQIPDLLNSLDSGTRATGMGGSLSGTSADSSATFLNPAGLGFLDKRALSVSYRNLPTSKTKVSGRVEDPAMDTVGYRGKNSFSALSVGLPMAHGTLGVSYNIGGFVKDRQRGTVNQGGNNLETFINDLDARTDFFTISYGTTNKSQSSSYGIGITYAEQGTKARRLLINDGVTSDDVNVDEKGTGFGILVGAQFIPKNAPNITYGLSYRSEIKLNYGGNDPGFIEKIPARLLGGVAIRQDGLRGGQDFIVYGAQAEYYFAAGGSGRYSRDAQTVVGFGAEYSYKAGNYRVPLRFGYNVRSRGNDNDFTSRSAFTFGVGYRPLAGKYTIDVNFGIPHGGGYDTAITVGYRF
jgi:long-subunit fatty acid transport protein